MFWGSQPLVASTPVTQVGTFHLDAPLSRVIPMFTALGERNWAPGWEPRILSGETERGTVFVTRGHNGTVTTWIVTDYRPDVGRVSYARFAEGVNVGLVDVDCVAVPRGGTDCTVRYTLTGVDAPGEQFVGHFLESSRYAQMMVEWQAAIDSALRRAAAP
jgi:hypothetical protein